MVIDHEADHDNDDIDDRRLCTFLVVERYKTFSLHITLCLILNHSNAQLFQSILQVMWVQSSKKLQVKITFSYR